MFCAIATTIERCKTEGVVDVFQVVKALRVQKPGAVRTVVRITSSIYTMAFMLCYCTCHSYATFIFQEQYQTVFEAVVVFLDPFETYSNF